MCGISGVYLKDKTSKKELEAIVDLMDKTQRKRGPDDRDSFIDSKNNLALGHRRLSFIDLSKAGRQPMAYRFGKRNFWITFNGEIYNFSELKKNLESKGRKFKTKTDTEVILALYAEYGEASFGMLRGMFAFGLWDEARKKIFLVKDRYGIKPLYYWSDRGRLIFASTVKAIEEAGIVPVQKEFRASIGFLLFGSVPLPLTTAKNILALSAGHYLVRDLGKEEKIVKYYDPLSAFTDKEGIDFGEAAEETRKILAEAVKIHLISDAPLGVFLSGGLDSSAIAALAAAGQEKPITTLSIKFKEKEYSEESYQKMMSERIKSDHREAEITKKDFFDSFEEIFRAMDQPTVDGVNTFFIAKAAKQAGLKAVLSGLGGDEIFFGYPSFKKIGWLRAIQNSPSFFKYALEWAPLLGERYAKAKNLRRNGDLCLYLAIRGLFAPDKVAEILGIDENEVLRFIEGIDGGEKTDNLSPGNLLSLLEIRYYLQNQLLKDTDFMAMEHSVEVRVPFLDHVLVEYLSSLPEELKIMKGENKPLLGAAVRDLIPEGIIKRKKMGFTFPFSKWLREGDLAVSGFGGRLGVSDLVSRFQKGNLHWSRFWALYVMEKFGISG